MSHQLLRLAALDEEDLAVISAHAQDAIVRVGDIRYFRATGLFALLCRRFDRSGGGRQPASRCLASLEFRRVLRVRTRAVDPAEGTAVLSLLAITFAASRLPPEGMIELTFAGGGSIRLAVECIEVSLRDLGPRWQARRTPRHDTSPPGERDDGSLA